MPVGAGEAKKELEGNSNTQEGIGGHFLLIGTSLEGEVFRFKKS